MSWRGSPSWRTPLGVTLAAMLERTERIVHGTTVATNALLERRGARVGLLTTKGHIDILEMREGLKEDRYNLRVAAARALGSARPAPRRAGADSLRWSRRGDAQQCIALRSHPGAKTPEGRLRRGLLPAQLSRPDARAHDGRGGPGSNAGAYVSLSSDVLRKSRSTSAPARRW